MAEYRLFYLGVDGHIYLSSEIVAPDDAGAIAEAGAHDVRTGMELWTGSRLVKAFSPTSALPEHPEGED